MSARRSGRRSGNRNWSNSGSGQQRDRGSQPPAFVRNREFAAAIDGLTRAYEAMSAGNPAGKCNFQLEDGLTCADELDGNHSIQEKILDRLAVNEHVKTFPRDIQRIKNRIIEKDSARREIFAVQGRWTPIDIHVNEASKWRFFCNLHDNQVFRPIEHNNSDPSPHPLDEASLTPQQYFLLSYRILLRIREESNGAGRAREMALTNHQRRSRHALVFLARNSQIAKGLDRTKEMFDEHYRSERFDSLVETPIDTMIELPLQLAVSDVYEPNRDGSSLFLTVHPSNTHPDNVAPYEHRVIVSRLWTASAVTTTTLQTLEGLLQDAGQSHSGTERFLAGVLRPVRNAFFSRDYEQRLSERTRTAIEQQVCDNVLEVMRQLFPWLI